jgi:hypothetical protein
MIDVKTPRRPSLRTVVMEFWMNVHRLLVSKYRIPSSTAMKALKTYRRRVGNVALNSDAADAADAIAAAVKRGGFAPIHQIRAKSE